YSRAICRVMSRSRKGAGLGLFMACSLKIEIGSSFPELLRLFPHADLDGLLFIKLLLRGIITDILRDLHRAEMGATHRTEVRDLGGVVRKRRIVEGASRVRVQRKIELIFPPELKPGL